MNKIVRKRSAKAMLVFVLVLNVVVNMLIPISSPVKAASTPGKYEVASGGVITLIGHTGSYSNNWSTSNSGIATVTQDTSDAGTAVVKGVEGKSGDVRITHTYKNSWNGSTLTETFDIHFGPPVDKTVHWIEEGKTAEIIIQSVQTKEGAVETPKVLFLGGICSSHSLQKNGVTAAINSLAKVADVDYYFYGLNMANLSNSGTPTTGTVPKGGKFNASLSTTNSVHISHFYFSEIIESLDLDDYDLIVIEYDGVRMASMGDYRTNIGMSREDIAEAISDNHYKKQYGSGSKKYYASEYSKHKNQDVTYADLEADLAAAAIKLVDAYAEDKVAWLLPTATQSGYTVGCQYLYDDNAFGGNASEPVDTDLSLAAWDALAIMAPEIWLAKNADGTYKAEKGTQPTTQTAIADALFSDDSIYRQRAENEYDDTTKEGMWTTYDNGDAIADLVSAKSEEIYRFQDVNITDVVAKGFKVVGISGQYLDESTNPPQWIDIDPASGNFKCSYLDETVTPSDWVDIDLTDPDMMNNVKGNKIQAEFDLGKLKSEKTRLVITIETSEEIKYEEDSEGNRVIATNEGPVVVVYDDGPSESDTPPTLPEPGVDMIKIANPASGESILIGDTVEYYFKVKNIGKVNFSSVRVTDEKLNYDKIFSVTLAPGETLVVVDKNKSYTPLTGEKVVTDTIPTLTATEADYAEGELFNAAKVEAVAGGSKIYDEGDTSHPVLRKAIEIDKTSDYDGKSSNEPVKEGQTINYTVTVKNTGDVTLNDIVVDDGLTGATAVAGTGYTVDASDATKATITSIEPGDTVNVFYQYTVTAQDVVAYSKDGVKLVNSVHVAVPDGPEADDSCEDTTESKKIDVDVKKLWADDDNYDGCRPDNVEVQLYRQVGNGEKNAVEGKKLTLSDSNYWKGTFSDLIKYDNGTEITYTVDEKKTSVINGTDDAGTYSIAISGDDENGFTVTNTHTPEKITISGSKVWNDAEYVGKKGYERPAITINLYGKTEDEAEATLADSVTVSSADADSTDPNKWNWSFEGQYKYRNGKEITYTVTESAVDGYKEASITDMTVTNTPVPKTDVVLIPVYVTVKKVDSATNSGVGLPGAKFTLEQKVAGGSYTMMDDDIVTGDDGTVDLEFYDEGEYLLTEIEAPEGYELNDPASYTITLTKEFVEVKLNEDKTLWQWLYSLFTDENLLDENNMFVVPNAPEKIDVSVEKVWEDGDDRDGLRPDSVDVQLYKKIGTGSETPVDGKKITLNEKNSWAGTFDDLVKAADGQEIVYTVKEVNTSVITGEDGTGTYAVNISGNETDGFTVTNTHTPETIDIEVNKVWVDENDHDCIRPDNVQVQLYKQIGTGEKKAVLGSTLTLNSLNEWKGTFEDLYKYENGETVVYSVDETKTDVITGTDGHGTYSLAVTGNISVGYTVTNTHTPEKVDISGTKVWNDAEYVGKKGYERPNIIINLYGKTEDETDASFVDSVTVSSADVDSNDENKWNWSFDAQYKYRNGKEIIYSVTETPVDGYEEASIADFTVTNTPVPKTDVFLIPVYITLKKVDSDTNTGVGLPGAKFTLEQKLANGSYSMLDDDIITGDDGTADMEFNEEGEYRLTEIEAPEGYELSDPASYTITLNKEFIEVKLNEDKTFWQWLYSLFTDENLLDGNNMFVVNNPSEKIDVSVEKVWDDGDDRDGIRPESVEIQLYKKVGTGSETPVDGKKLTLNEANSWAGSFDDLAKSADGKTIVYSVQEVNTAVITGVDGTGTYDVNVEGNEKDGFTVTNTHTPEKASIKVSKVWSDEDDRDGCRPDSVQIQLYKQVGTGERKAVSDSTLTLSSANGWKGTFADLFKYENGEEIKYSVDETKTTVINGTDGAGTYSLAVTGNEASGYTVTNTHTPEKVNISGTKVWNDADYVGKTGYERPNITINLYGKTEDEPSATIVTSKTVSSADVDSKDANKWNWSFDGQYKYRNGKEIIYTVTEKSVDGYEEASITDFTVTNTPVAKEDIHDGASFMIKKVDSTNPTGAGLQGAKFKLEQKGKDDAYTTIKEDIVTGDDGTVIVEISKEGEYRLTETIAPEGYELASDAKSYNIKYDEKFIKVELNKQKSVWQWLYGLFSDTNELDKNNVLTVSNDPVKTNIAVKKVWNDDNDRDKLRPASVEIQLYKKVGNGNETIVDGKKLTLNTANNWAGSFDDLATYTEGQKITYSISEVKTSVITGADGKKTYGISITGSEADGFTVTNKHTPNSSKVNDDDDEKDKDPDNNGGTDPKDDPNNNVSPNNNNNNNTPNTGDQDDPTAPITGDNTNVAVYIVFVNSLLTILIMLIVRFVRKKKSVEE